MDLILFNRIKVKGGNLSLGDAKAHAHTVCGFSSLSYFDYVFKKEYGITSLDYRKISNRYNMNFLLKLWNIRL